MLLNFLIVASSPAAKTEVAIELTNKKVLNVESIFFIIFSPL
jgi:hypothetical protein